VLTFALHSERGLDAQLLFVLQHSFVLVAQSTAAQREDFVTSYVKPSVHCSAVHVLCSAQHSPVFVSQVDDKHALVNPARSEKPFVQSLFKHVGFGVQHSSGVQFSPVHALDDADFVSVAEHRDDGAELQASFVAQHSLVFVWQFSA
jgi:hypothetical protein